jgi:hypothetical protein
VHERDQLVEGAHEPEPVDVDARAAAPRRLASAVGNARFGMLMREGRGILPGGAVHPDVTATLAHRAGGGVALDGGVRDRMSGVLGDSLDDVRVHDDAGADRLATSVSARAFTVGSDVYFSAGAYRPGTADGDGLLAHELTHVAQQRDAPEDGPLEVSQPGDALESEADDVARHMADGDHAQ